MGVEATIDGHGLTVLVLMPGSGWKSGGNDHQGRVVAVGEKVVIVNIRLVTVLGYVSFLKSHQKRFPAEVFLFYIFENDTRILSETQQSILAMCDFTLQYKLRYLNASLQLLWLLAGSLNSSSSSVT